MFLTCRSEICLWASRKKSRNEEHLLPHQHHACPSHPLPSPPIFPPQHSSPSSSLWHAQSSIAHLFTRAARASLAESRSIAAMSIAALLTRQLGKDEGSTPTGAPGAREQS